MLGQYRVAPHLFQFIELPGFGLHNMYHYVHVVDQHPLHVLVAFVFVSGFATLLAHLFFDTFANSPDLRAAGSFTDHKKIGYGFGYFSEVERDNVVGFFILYCLYDGFENP
jgi:hypothetical protein